MITLKSFWSHIHTISAQYTFFEILVDSAETFKDLSPSVDSGWDQNVQTQCNLQWEINGNVSEISMIPKVGRVWGDLKSKFRGKTSFLSVSHIDKKALKFSRLFDEE